MLAAEKTSFANLMVTPTAQNLIRVFFLREQMKKLAGSGNKVNHVHVIGAGAMGGDIAAWCAGQGLRVTLADMKPEPIAGAVKRAADLFGKIMRGTTEFRDALDRLVPDLGGEGVRNADLIIEAVPENLALKQKVYAGLEPTHEIRRDPRHQYLKHSAAGIAPPRFNIPGGWSACTSSIRSPGCSWSRSSVTTATIRDNRCGRRPLSAPSSACRCRSNSPGFVVNRALTPYMLEAMVMLDENVDKATIDAAARKFGMPMGPIELADQVGLDICLAVGDMLRSKFPDLLPATPPWLRDKVAKGELGRKTGKGFYVWKDGKAEKAASAPATPEPTPEMIDRLILPIPTCASPVCARALRTMPTSSTAR